MRYFLYGDTPLELKYSELIKDIKKENPGIITKVFDANLKEDEGFIQSISINSMFGGMELIILKRLNTLSKGDQFIKLLDNFIINNKILVVTFEEKLNDYGKAEKPASKTLLKLVEKSFKCIEARQAKESKSLLFYIEKELGILEHQAEELLSMFDDNSALVKNEVEKIKTFLNGEDFSFEKVENIISYSKEYSLNTLIEAFLNGKKNKLIHHLREDKSYMGFLYLLTGELETLYKLKALQNNRVLSTSISYNAFKDRTYSNIKKYFSTSSGRPLHAYPLFLKLKFVNKYDEAFLLKRLEDILDIEYKFKSGQGDDALMVESFIASFHKL